MDNATINEEAKVPTEHNYRSVNVSKADFEKLRNLRHEERRPFTKLFSEMIDLYAKSKGRA